MAGMIAFAWRRRCEPIHTNAARMLPAQCIANEDSADATTVG